MSAPTERRRRGFTILELMVASAVGLVVLTAAMAAFELQSQFSRNTERLLGTQASAGLGLTMMQRDLENAGLRFRGGVQTSGLANSYASVVRAYDNIGTPNILSLRNNPLGTTSIVAWAGTTRGFVPGTDAFEVYQGSSLPSAQRLGAQVSTVTPQGPTTVELVISPNPFVVNEYNAAGATTGPVLMMWSDDVHCMGRITGTVSATFGPGGTATVRVSTVNADFRVPGAAWPVGCPKNGQNVEVLEQRRRYLIYRTDDASPGRPARVGLHVQTNAPCNPLGAGTVCLPDLQDPPLMVAEGVDDMQLAWRVPDVYAPTSNGWCQRSTTETSCGFEQPGAADDPVIGKRMAAIIGAQINVSSHGQELFHRPGEGPPALLNHIPAGAPDNVVRSVMQTSVIFRNLVNP
jgi:prepilin-type N-terminal cleavage/methylation domain-containing protein